jgi:predicted DNA-binding transcriptional regulator YafY
MVQSGVHFNAEQLAQELGVSERTVFREIKTLEAAGVSIEFDSKRACYRVCTDGTAVPYLTDDELTALAVAANLSPLTACCTLGLRARQGLAKVVAKAKPSLRQQLQNLQDYLVAKPYLPPGKEGILRLIISALTDARQVRLTYESQPGKPPLRTKVAPFRMLVLPRQWVLVGRSSYHRKTCEFDLARVLTAELTEDPFEPPPVPRHDHRVGERWQ